MRKALLALPIFAAIPIAAASAADIAVKAPPAAPPPYVFYNWTGFYVGLEAGGGWARSTTTVITTPGTSFPPGTVENSVDYSGALGGFYGGYNYQINQFVFGIDGDYTWAGLQGNSTDHGVTGFFDVAHHDDTINWVATATGRVGYAVDKWLFFGKGGWAWAGFHNSATQTNAAGTFLVAKSESRETRDGWTAGGGLEYAVSQNIIFKLEGDYVKFNTANFNSLTVVQPGANLPLGLVGSFARSATSDLVMFKGGVEYKF